MFTPPFVDRLASASSVLIAGAGGGFDVFSGLPLYFALRERGVEAHLASLTFTYIGATEAEHLGRGVFRVDADTIGPSQYFPERHLAAFLEQRGEPAPVWTVERQGVRALKLAYERLHQRLGFDTLVLVDGGTDSLMRGDETGLGTPAEDIASILAANALPVDHRYLLCLGFGVDRYHGVSHAQFLERVADLARDGAYLGAWALLPEMPAVRTFVEATEYVQARTPGRESIVCASILSAIEGQFGNVHRLERTRRSGSDLWINPLMSMYWAFELGPVADRVLYADWVEDTDTFTELVLRIEAYRKDLQIRRWDDIPL